MKTEPIPNGRSLPVFARCSRAAILTIAILVTLQSHPGLRAQGQSGQGSGAARGGELISLDFSSAPLGAPPKELRVLRGKLDVVEKDGTHMLRSSEDATFLVSVPEKIPNRFVLEFDLVPKISGWANTTELSFEGTREVSHSEDSAHVLWSNNKISVIGGGQPYAGGQIDMPEDLKEEVIGNLTKVRAEFDGSSLTVQTNGRTVFESKTAKFNRGRILRVSLGGTDEDENAVYLARMRMTALDGPGGSTAQQQSGLASTRASGSQSGSSGSGSASNEMTDPAQDTHSATPVSSQSITGITVTVDAAGVATVTWNPLSVAATYQVLRWNVADAYCCTNMSRPGEPLQTATWIDGLLPKPGTYAYRVIAQTSGGLVYGDTQFNFGGTATPPAGVAVSPAPTAPLPTTEPVPILTNEPAPLPVASTTTTTATGTPTTGGTIVQPDGTTAPYSSGPRTVSVMTTEPAPSSDTVLPAPSTLDTVEPVPEVPTDGLTTVGTVVQGTSTTEPVTAILAEPVLQTGTITPIVGVATSEPASTDSGSGGGGALTNEMQPSSQTSGGGGMPTSGRYRITVGGLAAPKPSIDDPLNLDGKGDEVYAFAVVMNWNRSSSQVTSMATVETLVHGDTGAVVPLPNRVRAGSGSATGGIVAGDYVPGSFDPKTTTVSTAPATDRFPLLAWEGTLSAGAEAIVVCPSLWEHDGGRIQFGNYRANWKLMPIPLLMSSSVIAPRLSSTSLESVLAPLSMAVKLAPPAATFMGPVTEGYKIAGLSFAPGIDRPIGMALGGPGILTYQERFVVFTQENLASIAVGSGITLALPMVEPLDPFLGGLYTLYVRVERIQ